jgi:hypothetical protein
VTRQSPAYRRDIAVNNRIFAQAGSSTHYYQVTRHRSIDRYPAADGHRIGGGAINTNRTAYAHHVSNFFVLANRDAAA